MKYLPLFLALCLPISAFGQAPTPGTVSAPPLSPPTALPPLPPGGGSALPVVPSPPLGPTTAMELVNVPLADVVAMYYQNNQRQYVLSPELIADQMPVSFRLDGNVDQKFFSLLSTRGYTVSSRGGVDYIAKTVDVPPDSKPFIYFTKHRNPVEIARALQPFFKGRFGALGSVMSQPVSSSEKASPTSATSQLDQNQEFLTFFGPEDEHKQLEKLLSQVDVPIPQVEIRAVLYEVSVNVTSGSSLNIVGQSLNKSGISFSANSGGQPLAGAASISIGAGGFSLAYSSLANDSRFKVLSSPVLRVVSGKTSSLTVGQEVPVLGSVSYTEGSSTPVQSVEYRQSGSLFTVTPTVYGSSVQIQVKQELSEFAATTASNIDSPTILRRAVDASLTLAPGEVAFLGGIDSDKVTDAKGGFWFLRNKQRGTQSSQLVLMIQAVPITPAPEKSNVQSQ